ncbi:MAG: hypothetical protein Q7T70_00180 [Polaromonas sp.]|nr:hypothetical protein [Polaromonas sp.]
MMLQAFVLVSTVFLLMSLGFSVLSSTPLLILKHDMPMDSRVIRQVFHYSYRLITIMASASSLAFALAGRPWPSLAMACIAIMALTLHCVVLSRMDTLRTTMHDGDTAAISRFRKLHVTGIALNLTQLVLLVWGITRVAF